MNLFESYIFFSEAEIFPILIICTNICIFYEELVVVKRNPLYSFPESFGLKRFFVQSLLIICSRI